MSSTFSRPLQAKDRIIILGDSITQAGNRSAGFVTLLREALGREELQWRPTGVSGDRIENARVRVVTEVLPLRPSIVMVFVGVNDVWHQSRGNVLEFAKAKQDMLALVEALRLTAGEESESEVGSPEIVLCTPMLIGEKADGSNSMDRDLEDLSEMIRTVATDSGCNLLDLRKLAIDYLKGHNPNQKSHSILTIDGVHLNRMGNQFLANAIAGYFELILPEPEAQFLRHVVLFKFNAGASPMAVQAALDSFQSLGNKIDTIVAIESGTNISPEGKSKGFTHGFTLTFRTATDRDNYLPHPEHVKFTQLVAPIVEDVCVFDYWAKMHATTR